MHIDYDCVMQRYSVDFHPKKEDAQIPLSTVDAEVFDSTSVKGTFLKLGYHSDFSS